MESESRSDRRRLLAQNRPCQRSRPHRRHREKYARRTLRNLRASSKNVFRRAYCQSSTSSTRPTLPSDGSINGTASTAPSNAATADDPFSGTPATARADLILCSEYGRLLASLGINGCDINNVNADPSASCRSEFLPQIAAIAAELRPWGVQTAISVDFGSPAKPSADSTLSILSTPRPPPFWKPKSTPSTRPSPTSPASS